MTQADNEYHRIINEVLEYGVDSQDRTNTGIRSIIGAQARFDVSKEFPLVTTKQVFWKTFMKEMLWMIQGGGGDADSASIMPLIRQNVRIWTEWPHRHYEQSTGTNIDIREFEQKLLSGEIDEKWAKLGPCYGTQWVYWKDYNGKTINQIQKAVDDIKSNPTSRRIMVSGWNVSQIDEMAQAGLPPCHYNYQFLVKGDELSLVYQMRSSDLGLGWCANQVNAAMFLHLMASVTGKTPKNLVWQGADVHLYSNHMEQINEQLTREPVQCSPQLVIKNKRDSIFDYTIDDLEIVNYEHRGKLSMPVAV